MLLKPRYRSTECMEQSLRSRNCVRGHPAQTRMQLPVTCAERANKGTPFMEGVNPSLVYIESHMEERLVLTQNMNKFGCVQW